MTSVFNHINSPELPILIRAGKVGVLPTDTLYGLVCSASNKLAVANLYKLKNRDKKPGTIIAASIDQLVGLGLKKRYLKAVEQYWPGAVSVVLPTDNPELSYLDQGVGTLAVRVVDDPSVASLLHKVGPLLTSSANTPGDDPAVSIAAAQEYFGGTIDFYVDGGDMESRQASTLIRIIDDTPEVLRQGSGIVTS